MDWVGQNSERHPHPVSTPPTKRGDQHPWGLHDLHGNVAEWCVDPWAKNYESRESGVSHDPNRLTLNDDPAPPRAIRGGDWIMGAQNVRSAYRSGRHPSDRDDGPGFRLLRLSPE